MVLRRRPFFTGRKGDELTFCKQPQSAATNRHHAARIALPSAGVLHRSHAARALHDLGVCIHNPVGVSRLADRGRAAGFVRASDVDRIAMGLAALALIFRRREKTRPHDHGTHCASGSICRNASARASKNGNSLVSKFPLSLRDDFRRPVPLRLRWRRATPARCLRGGAASRHNRPCRAGGSVPGQSRALRR